MTNSEINEFLAQFDASTEDQLNELKQTVTQSKLNRRFRWAVYDDKRWNNYEKSILLLMLQYDARPTFGVVEPLSMKEIADYLAISITTVKRAIRSLMNQQVVCKYPYGSGYMLTNPEQL